MSREAKDRRQRRDIYEASETPSRSRANLPTPLRTPYRDFANTSTPEALCQIANDPSVPQPPQKRAPSKSRFPILLHRLLEASVAQQYQDVVAWSPHGRSFHIIDRDRFTQTIMPSIFRHQSQFASFQRQLNLYGFLRITRKGADRGSYYHELFLRGRPSLCAHIHRQRINGNEVRKGTDLDLEPRFDQLPPVGLVEPVQAERKAPAWGQAASGAVASSDRYSFSSDSEDDNQDTKPRAVPSGERTRVLPLLSTGNLNISPNFAAASETDRAVSNPQYGQGRAVREASLNPSEAFASPQHASKRPRIGSPKRSDESGSSSSNDTASRLLKRALKAEPLPEIESMVHFLEDVDLDDDDDDELS